jgi:integrase/recombinase XerD
MGKQAKTLTATEVRRVLDYVATRKHNLRNRALVLTSFYAGLRAKEIAMLRYCDVLDSEGRIHKEVWLAKEQTKGGEGRKIFINDRLQKELQHYVKAVPPQQLNSRLFYSQKSASEGFSPNSLAQYFHYLYKNAGIEGASSHSGRRTFITNLAERGVGVRVIMGLSGHRALSSVQRYIDCNDNLLRKAVELI